MIVNVGEDKVFAKMDLREIFPKEFSNRLLINQFITYILNNFFEKSQEKIVSGYIGEIVESMDGIECYVKEPSTERQLHQIIPVVQTGSEDKDFITFTNFINGLKHDGCVIKDQNKLLASTYWSWCPQINVDMFLNFNNYFWVPQDKDEMSFRVLTQKIDVEKEIIGKSSYEYFEVDSDGMKIDETSYMLQQGDRLVFLEDSSGKYNNIPYMVEMDERTGISLTPVITPLVVLSKETSITTDILGQKNYTYVDETHNIQFNLKNGMRLVFLNDINKEYNNKPLFVSGVGSSIKFIDDSYLGNDYSELDYITMERGSLDGNDWSMGNRWVHRSALEEFNLPSITRSYGGTDKSLKQAITPIICFRKDLELFKHGTFHRGYVLTTTDLKINTINGLTRNQLASKLGVKYEELVDGSQILLFTTADEVKENIYEIDILQKSDTVILTPKANGQDKSSVASSTLTMVGDTVSVLHGKYAGQQIFFDGVEWIEGQKKSTVNQQIKFNLYDTNKISLSNPVEYPNSTFDGSVVFDYTENEDKTLPPDVSIGKALVTDGNDGNYRFNNYLASERYEFTPENEYTRQIEGFYFLHNIREDYYVNDWNYNPNTEQQYVQTRIEVKNDIVLDEDKTFDYTLKYTPALSGDITPVIVYKNGKYVPQCQMIVDEDGVSRPNRNHVGYYLKDNQLSIYQSQVGDIYDIFLLTDDIVEDNEENTYVYGYPLSLTVNQFNEDFPTITYNNCFDQMVEIIQNQKGLVGSANGVNNYYSLNPNLSVGTKIVQHSSSIIRPMILNNNLNTSLRSAMTYSMNSYVSFKNKFFNVLDKMYLNGEIYEDNREKFENTPSLMDSTIKTIIGRIDLGKEGVQPFFNNGMIQIFPTAYIPSTPAYLGVAPCYKPHYEEMTESLTEVKPTVLICHDGSLSLLSGTIKDLFVKRFEDLVYESIHDEFKGSPRGLNRFKVVPGKFRQGTYTRKEVLDTYAQFAETWAYNNQVSFEPNTDFNYSTEDEDAWRTWNYTGMIDCDGRPLYGSYRAIYLDYYDTYRPDTHPWEMLGLGEKPTWWDARYGCAPYSSNNINMWKDIENGYVAEGSSKGYYKEFERKGLFDKYLPVDENGKLKSLLQIGIIDHIPMVQLARKKWVIGDVGETEFALMQTSEYRYMLEMLSYLLRPVEWIEKTWDTVNHKTLFANTSYEQIIDKTTGFRENLQKTVVHNEMVDGTLVRQIGSQQWVSDYLLYNNLDITKQLGDKLRTADIKQGYRCAGFYQKGTVELITDSYGVIPEENVHLNLVKSFTPMIATYSGIIIEKTKKGYMIDGFDKTYPYFKVKEPELSGKKTTMEENGKSVYYYKQWKEGYVEIPYKKEFTNVQDVYNFIIGYGKHLEDNENWYFDSLTPSGEIANFRISGSTFVRWSVNQIGPDAEGRILMLNPAIVGVGINNKGLVADFSEDMFGTTNIRDINDRPMLAKDVNIIRTQFNTHIQAKEKGIALIKLRTYQLEHLITTDNKTLFDDVLYNPKYSTKLSRVKVSGVKVRNWYGTLYAPGYLVQSDGAIPNFDKKANDLRYIFDTDDVRCQGDYGKYSKNIIGYNPTKTFKQLFQNDKTMFDFYKGVIPQKGTKNVINKMNRSTYISSTGNDIGMSELWGFRAGEFGYTKENSINEFLLDQKKMNYNPQIITFETTLNYYYDKNKSYKVGDIVIQDNYEYACKEETTGKFDTTKWNKLRFIGNYMIFGDDDNWVKKSSSKLNTFRYSNDFTTNPIGGTPMIQECEYIVANDTELDELVKTMALGEVVWVAKKSNNDWDVLKKTGKNKLVSLRYNTIEDLINQPDEVPVYHFKDNKTDYYTQVKHDDVLLTDTTPVYGDIDCNKQVLTWGQVGKPEYTGVVSEYVNGYKYKVKLYNTVFTTTTPQDRVNTGTVLQELHSGRNVSYKSLTLTMSKYKPDDFIYKYNFSITADTHSSGVVITINGREYRNPKNNRVDVVVCGGDTINWEVRAHACGIRRGTETVATDGSAQPLNIIVPMVYQQGYEITRSTTPKSEVLPLYYPGVYDIKMVGAGGGAGGGSTKKHHGRGGNGGASGAYLHGLLTVSNRGTQGKTCTTDKEYTLVTGLGGKGGAALHASGLCGTKGEDSYIKCNSSKILVAGGGIGGAGGRYPATFDGEGNRLGTRGIYEVKVHNEFQILSDTTNGNNGGIAWCQGSPGRSAYPNSTYGAGGMWVDEGWGRKGDDGYTKVVYMSSVKHPEIIKNNVNFAAREGKVSGILTYSSYTSPYVIPPNEKGQMLAFYSYDVLEQIADRPNATTVSDDSVFYRNRSRQITAFHSPNVIKNLWYGNTIGTPSHNYVKGDKVTHDGKYYICLATHEPTEVFEDNIKDWKEFKPTYYYKITESIEGELETILPTYAKYGLYSDMECTQHVTKDNLEEGETQFFMTTNDLKLEGGDYELGSDLTLVDELAIYRYLKPTYLSEPTWGYMTPFGTHSIISGTKTYYSKYDIETLETKKTENIYSDAPCTQIVQMIEMEDLGEETETTLKYRAIDMTYEDIIDVKSLNIEPSYELKDNELVLYTYEPNGYLDINDGVYFDSKLLEYAGTYGDYIPQWETEMVEDPESEEGKKEVSKEVNRIFYKEKGDIFYITNDCYAERNKLSTDEVKIVKDSQDLASIIGSIVKPNQRGWFKLEYIKEDYLFDTVGIERALLSTKDIESCYLVDNDTDETLVQVQIYDPILNIVPNNVLEEVNYITSKDPVIDYNDTGKWNDNRVGYLWWDTSKVRYVDYHQGDYEYQRLNWGKQLPGSEIAIMEWTKSVDKPTDGRQFVTYRLYNPTTESVNTFYYFWSKNPVRVPQLPFRKRSALQISATINNPTDEGIVWFAPINGDYRGKKENTFILSNYNNVMTGQNAVLQINMYSSKDVLKHTEWVAVKENTTDEIPDYLWDKITTSLIGEKDLGDGTSLPVPNPSLKGHQKLGLSIRPQQTVFNNRYIAQENFISVVNDIFASRDSDHLTEDTKSSLVQEIDRPNETDYDDKTATKLEMMGWKDESLIGQRILVESDETLNGLWAIYKINAIDKGVDGYELVKYQQYDINHYLYYLDWYIDNEVKYLTPLLTVDTQLEAHTILKDLGVGAIVACSNDEKWQLWQNRYKENFIEPTLVGQSQTLLQISSLIYDYVNQNIDDKNVFIKIGDKTLTKFDYIKNECKILLKKILEYFQ